MAILIPRKRAYSRLKPTVKRGINTNKYAPSFVYQFYDESADIIGTKGSLIGTQEFSAGVGGIGLTGGSAAGDYLDTNNKVTGFGGDGLVTDVVVMSMTTTAIGYLFSTLNDGGSLIDDLGVNLSENEATQSGAVFRQIRTAVGAQLRASTGNIGINDGNTHVIVFVSEGSGVLKCYVDGIERNLTYGLAQTYGAIPESAQYDYWVGTRNIRNVAGSGSGDARIYHWARLPYAVSEAEGLSLSEAPYQILNPRKSYFVIPSVLAVTCTLSGTATASITEADITAGGKTIILTLANDTWVAAGATFDAERQGIIDGLVSAQSESTGWNNIVKANEPVASVVRTSDTVVTITLEAH